jgi:acyl carrier protein
MSNAVYQYRMRTAGGSWTDWRNCDRRMHWDIRTAPTVGQYEFETQALLIVANDADVEGPEAAAYERGYQVGVEKALDEFRTLVDDETYEIGGHAATFVTKLADRVQDALLNSAKGSGTDTEAVYPDHERDDVAEKVKATLTNVYTIWNDIDNDEVLDSIVDHNDLYNAHPLAEVCDEIYNDFAVAVTVADLRGCATVNEITDLILRKRKEQEAGSNIVDDNLLIVEDENTDEDRTRDEALSAIEKIVGHSISLDANLEDVLKKHGISYPVGAVIGGAMKARFGFVVPVAVAREWTTPRSVATSIVHLKALRADPRVRNILNDISELYSVDDSARIEDWMEDIKLDSPRDEIAQILGEKYNIAFSSQKIQQWDQVYDVVMDVLDAQAGIKVSEPEVKYDPGLAQRVRRVVRAAVGNGPLELDTNLTVEYNFDEIDMEELRSDIEAEFEIDAGSPVTDPWTTMRDIVEAVVRGIAAQEADEEADEQLLAAIQKVAAEATGIQIKCAMKRSLPLAGLGITNPNLRFCLAQDLSEHFNIALESTGWETVGDVEDAISGELWAKHMYAKQVPPLTMDAVAQDIVRLAMEREIVKGPVVISNGAYAGVRLVEMGLKLLRARTALCEAINQKYRITML